MASTDHPCCARSPVGWRLGTAGGDSKSDVRKDRELTLKFKTVIAVTLWPHTALPQAMAAPGGPLSSPSWHAGESHWV